MGFDSLMVACMVSRLGMSAVVEAMLFTTALTSGSSCEEAPFWDEDAWGRLDGEGVMAFSVRARMAFLDFLVPNVRPRVERAERGVWVGPLAIFSYVMTEVGRCTFCEA